jgi:curved DNA-binding protein CbpA
MYTDLQKRTLGLEQYDCRSSDTAQRLGKDERTTLYYHVPMSSNTRPQVKSLYDSLGVADDATTAEINIAFSEKKANLEPKIRSGDPSAASELVMWQEAHRTLTDFTERRRYDLMLADRRVQAEQTASLPKRSTARPSRAYSSSVASSDDVAWYENKMLLAVGALMIFGTIAAVLYESRSSANEKKLQRELVVQQERAQQAEQDRIDAQEAANAARNPTRTAADMADERIKYQERQLRRDAERAANRAESNRDNVQARLESKERREKYERESREQRELSLNRQRDETERRRAIERDEKDRRELINIYNADGRHHEAQKLSRSRGEELRTQECWRLNARC